MKKFTKKSRSQGKNSTLSTQSEAEFTKILRAARDKGVTVVYEHISERVDPITLEKYQNVSRLISPLNSQAFLDTRGKLRTVEQVKSVLNGICWDVGANNFYIQ